VAVVALSVLLVLAAVEQAVVVAQAFHESLCPPIYLGRRTLERKVLVVPVALRWRMTELPVAQALSLADQ
jgi:hypothetical protein